MYCIKRSVLQARIKGVLDMQFLLNLVLIELICILPKFIGVAQMLVQELKIDASFLFL